LVGGGAVFVVVVGAVVFVYLRQQGGEQRSKSGITETADQIGPYRLGRHLHTGFTSQVFEAVEMVSGRHFAMKVMLPEHAKDPHQRSLFFHEAEVGLELAHPNVIKIVRVFRETKTPAFVMEYFPAGSLRGRLQTKDWEFIKEHNPTILKDLATALAYMNSSGWVHRDVKPDNVLVAASGDLRLIDFAIAQRTGKGGGLFRKRRKLQGTRSYMSPEQIRNEKLDGRADIYSFGATIYELTTGRPPFRGKDAEDLLNRHLAEKPVSPDAYNPELTKEFSKLVLRCLAKKRDERPSSFHEVLMELRKIKIYKNQAPPRKQEQP
jgi:serine/threonine protein kinase